MANLLRADPLRMPASGETPAERMACARPLAGTPGQAYVEGRGIALAIAAAAGVRFDPDWNGRPAVLVAMRDRAGGLAAVHGRYLSTLRGQDKMFTVGTQGGVVCVGDGLRACPIILVEGLFDALSLQCAGFGCVATIGRWAPWLAQVRDGREAWLAFDANRPGAREAARHAALFAPVSAHRLLPPSRCKDWNTALHKFGPARLASAVRASLGARSAGMPAVAGARDAGSWTGGSAAPAVGDTTTG